MLRKEKVNKNPFSPFNHATYVDGSVGPLGGIGSSGGIPESKLDTSAKEKTLAGLKDKKRRSLTKAG
jgi:hypothetical protein